MKNHMMFIIILTGFVWMAAPIEKSLDELLDIALSRNHELNIAEMQYRESQALEKAAYSGFMPNVNLSITKPLNSETTFSSGGAVISFPTSSSARVGISETLFDGARSWYNSRSTKNRIHSSKVNIRSKNEDVIQSVKSAYYQYLAAVELFDVALFSRDLSDSQLQLVEQQYELQAVSETDLLKAQVRKGQAESQVIQTLEGEQQALNNLRYSIGYSMDEPLEVAAESVELLDLEKFEEARERLINQNSKLEMARIRMEGSVIALKTQFGVFFPSIWLSTSYTSTGDGVSELMTGLKDESPTTSINLSIPIFSGMSNKGRYDQLKYNVLTAEASKSQLQDQLLKELDNLLTSLETYHKLIPINEEIIHSAEMDSDLAQEKYNLGANDILDLLNAQVSLIQAKSDLVKLKYSAKITEAQLESLLGTDK